MVRRGAMALFIPTNNAMPAGRGGPELVSETRALDVQRAAELGVAVVRADVVGRIRDLVSYGSSGIVDRSGDVLCAARAGCPELLIADIGLTTHGTPVVDPPTYAD